MTPVAPPTLENELPTGLYSEEEKALILAQIEQAAGSDRITGGDEVFRPRKQGILFPVAVNVAAAVLIVGAWFGANAYFQTRQEGLKLRSNQLFSAESKLLSKVLQDAKAQMEAASAEIDKIQGDLQKAASDRANLEKSFETRVAAQDRALRKELADALEAEKTRLRATGLNEAEVAQRLLAYEDQKNSEFNTRLETYRKQAQAEIDQRAQALTALQAKLQTTVSETERLRLEVEKQNREREGALRSQLSVQSADLEVLKKEREELNQFFRQVEASLGSMRTAVESRDQDQTRAALASLKQVLVRASASTSEAVRERAAAQMVLADTLEASSAALAASSPRAESEAQIASLRSQLKNEQTEAALRTAASQQALASVAGLQQDVDDLVRRLDESTSETFSARIEVQYLQAQVEAFERTVEELTPYRARSETLSKLFAAEYPSAIDRFAATFGSPEGRLVFPGFDASWDEVSRQIQESGDTKLVRKKAFDEVLAFTTYLRGQSPSPDATRTAAERLSRTDEDYKKVIEGIQALAATGNAESKVSTDRFQLYGTVAAVSGSKIVLEPLTKVRPQVGDLLELRRVQGKKETVLGRGAVLSSSSQKVEIDWQGNPAVPLSGDAAFLVLP